MSKQHELFPEPPPDLSIRRYSLGVWWLNHDRYWPCKIDGRRTLNLTLHELRAALRRLCGRPIRRDSEDKFGWRRRRCAIAWSTVATHDCDTEVLVERTDGREPREIVKGWKR